MSTVDLGINIRHLHYKTGLVANQLSPPAAVPSPTSSQHRWDVIEQRPAVVYIKKSHCET